MDVGSATDLRARFEKTDSSLVVLECAGDDNEANQSSGTKPALRAFWLPAAAMSCEPEREQRTSLERPDTVTRCPEVIEQLGGPGFADERWASRTRSR